MKWLLYLFACVVVSVTEVEAAKAKIAYYREPPHGACRFVTEQFHVELDRFQEEVLEAWVDPSVRRISLQAAAGVGKSAVMSWCAWHFLGVCCVDEVRHPKGLATGITSDNLRANFWAEMAVWQGVSPWLSTAFEHTDTSIFARSNPKTWFLGRRAWPRTGNADQQGATLSGLHSAAVAAFIDESGAIPTTVLRAAEQALADNPPFGKIIQSGNPISLEGMLYEAATRARHLWRVIIVTNDPEDPRRAKRGDIEWAREQIALYGRHNPWVMAYILGKFPPSSINTLLGIEDVEAAIKRELTPDKYEHQQKRIGVDVARFGDDRTVLFPRQGLKAFYPVMLRGADTNAIVARILLAKSRWQSDLELIDNSFSWGNGVIDNLRNAKIRTAWGVDFAGPPNDPRYKNRRAEGWIEMAEAIKRGASLPDVPEIRAELTTPTYTFHDGVLQLEEKDLVKKRLGRSPDLGDALALTYMVPDLPRGIDDLTMRVAAGGGPRAATEYDHLR